MKLLLICFAVAVLVFADDVFFYDQAAGHMVHRITGKCFAMPLTQEQQANVHNHDFNLQLQQLMRDLADDDNSTTPLAPEDATYFIVHHCHNRDLFLITQ